MLKINDQIPLNISVVDSNDQEINLSKLLTSKYLVIYFYPKDQTPGCTEEACSFRDNNELLKSLGARVIGISSDNQKSHSKFKEKEKLNFELFSDADHSVQEAFGVWGEKSMFGKKYMGTLRSTFLVDKQGKILAIWEPKGNLVKTKQHAEDVAEVIKELEK